MRALLLCAVSGVALLTSACSAGNSDPIPFNTQTAVDFFMSACKGSPDNLSTVARLAEQQGWTSMVDPDVAENDHLKVTGMWRVNQNDQSYIVTTGVGTRTSTACQVTFDDPKPKRDDFFAAMSSALKLRNEIDQGSGWRMEIYRIEDFAPKYVTLLFVSSTDDGSVYNASVMGPP